VDQHDRWGLSHSSSPLPLLTVCPMPRLYPGGRAQPRQANLRWCGCRRLPFSAQARMAQVGPRWTASAVPTRTWSG
jgi:hypothetical protein